MSTPIQPTCPTGGSWYICVDSSTKFIGCCKSNPCSNSAGCPISDLSSASFNSAAYGTFPDQTCGNGQGDFYTCTFSNGASFIGCCRSNACQQGGCPQSDLGSMALSPDLNKEQAFLADAQNVGVVTGASNPTTTLAVNTGTNSITAITTGLASSLSLITSITSPSSSSIAASASTSSISSTSTAPTLSLRPLSTATPSGSPSATSNSTSDAGSPFSMPMASMLGGMSKGTIAGLTVAAFILVTALAALIFFLCSRRRQRFERQVMKEIEEADHDPSNFGRDFPAFTPTPAPVYNQARSSRPKSRPVSVPPAYEAPVNTALQPSSQYSQDPPLQPSSQYSQPTALQPSSQYSQNPTRYSESSNYDTQDMPPAQTYYSPPPQIPARRSPAPAYDFPPNPRYSPANSNAFAVNPLGASPPMAFAPSFQTSPTIPDSLTAPYAYPSTYTSYSAPLSPQATIRAVGLDSVPEHIPTTTSRRRPATADTDDSIPNVVILPGSDGEDEEYAASLAAGTAARTSRSSVPGWTTIRASQLASSPPPPSERASRGSRLRYSMVAEDAEYR
ncbi:hypothetical protein BT63DRAFT_461054 [Microthyrium microscopicum]|uniref:Uncharacterized protein n=1 Tax=Microthyrium microscopicum TaxID=703497 RepID=A0A6A6TWU4_9PEZI|nr:hypothetical protein BT63DRAFT_461054 [Microthyrium microscopicum]